MEHSAALPDRSSPCWRAIVIDLSVVDQQSSQFHSFKALVDEALGGQPDDGFSAMGAASI